MSLSARLYISGHKNEKTGIRILACDFEFIWPTDKQGRTTGKLMGGKINITVAIENDGEILNWVMFHSVKNGRIVFIGKENGKALKTINFVDGLCVRYKDSFQEKSEEIVEMTISTREISIEGATHYNCWIGHVSV
ncbi:type VI secretion system tube protein TssD [uncultured Draconibacterium sp.]|jgi:hypothetical protein|uniref:type VI secretion system tube protein TssD n=1 Tax=uncultured Draconibacterium sp. TaxID=1573823 RepID=UPI0032177E3A